LGRQAASALASTVRNYLSPAIEKTGAQTRAEAYATALSSGWI